jgi:hypothetical protein
MKADTRLGELPPHHYEDNVPHALTATNMGPAHNTTDIVSNASPNIQAQRRREVEWLEAEEARMRQLREQLLRQDGLRR